MLIKRFVLRALLFFIIAFIVLTIESFYKYFTRSFEETVIGNDVYLAIKKSKVRKKVKVLIIGDSVGQQLYSGKTYNDDIYSLTTNQAVSMAGQYMLLKTFIDKNQGNLPNEVLLIMIPTSFNNNLDQIFTYNSFLKPFYRKEYSSMMTDTCRDQIRKIPFYYISQWPIIVNTNWSPEYESPHPYPFISPISINYLLKIKELCIKNKLPIKFYCPPIKESRRELVMSFSKNNILPEKTGFKNEFASYFKGMVVLPDSLFQDQMHFKKQYIPTDYYKLL